MVKGICGWTDNAGNYEPLNSIFPDGVAPVVRATPGGGREDGSELMLAFRTTKSGNYMPWGVLRESWPCPFPL
jgi:hypothetical protein